MLVFERSSSIRVAPSHPSSLARLPPCFAIYDRWPPSSATPSLAFLRNRIRAATVLVDELDKLTTEPAVKRRYFIGGSDARIIMGDDETALIRLWHERRGESEPEDLSGNLVVQLGLATEALNRRCL